MSESKPLTHLPNVNDLLGIDAHRRAVLSEFREVLTCVYAAVKESLPKTMDIFKLVDGPLDLAVHGMNTRYLVKLALATKKTVAVEEDDVVFELERVANCGLCVTTTQGSVRILKGRSDGVLKAHSEARVQFSTNEQLEFEFDAKNQTEKVDSLNLFALWSMDSTGEFVELLIACPRKVDAKGVISCVWISKFDGAQSLGVASSTPPPPDDLEGIEAIAMSSRTGTKA